MEQVILIWNNLNMKKEGEKGEPTSKIFFNQYRIFSRGYGYQYLHYLVYQKEEIFTYSRNFHYQIILTWNMEEKKSFVSC